MLRRKLTFRNVTDLFNFDWAKLDLVISGITQLSILSHTSRIHLCDLALSLVNLINYKITIATTGCDATAYKARRFAGTSRERV